MAAPVTPALAASPAPSPAGNPLIENPPKSLDLSHIRDTTIFHKKPFQQQSSSKHEHDSDTMASPPTQPLSPSLGSSSPLPSIQAAQQAAQPGTLLPISIPSSSPQPSPLPSPLGNTASPASPQPGLPGTPPASAQPGSPVNPPASPQPGPPGIPAGNTPLPSSPPPGVNPPAQGQAAFVAQQVPAPPAEPIYLGNGKFDFDSHIYKVTLYSDDTSIEENDVDPSKSKAWIATAIKVVKALKEADLLPDSAKQIEAVDVNFSTGQMKEKRAGTKDYTDIPQTSQKGIFAPTYTGSDIKDICNEISGHAIALQKYRKKCEEDKKTTESLRYMNVGQTSQNDDKYKPHGSNACTSISVVTALAMANQLDRIKTEEIDPLQDEGVKLHVKTNRAIDNNPDHNAQCISLRPMQVILKNKELFELPSGSDEEIELELVSDYSTAPLESAPAVEDGGEKEFFKNKFKEIVGKLVQKAEGKPENPKILSGIITMQGSSYALSVKISEINGKTNYTIEFADSHGMPKSGNKAYTDEFTGTKEEAINKFVEFFTATKTHTYYRFAEDESKLKMCLKWELEKDEKPSTDADIDRKIVEMRNYNDAINQLEFTEIRPKKQPPASPAPAPIQVTGNASIKGPGSLKNMFST